MTREKWTSRSLAGEFRHRIFYTVLRLGGRAPAYFMLHFVVLFYTLLPSVRLKARPYLAKRFPDAGPAAMLWHTFRLNLEFGKVLVDRAAFAIIGDTRYIPVNTHRKRVIELRDRNNGVIVASGHCGCWQTAMAALEYLERPIEVVLVQEQGNADRHFFEHGSNRERYAHIGTINPAGELGGTLEMLATLRKGNVLVVMADRAMGSDNYLAEATFMGRTMRFPVSIFRLASMTGAPIVVSFTRRLNGRTMEAWTEDIIEVPAGLGRDPHTYAPYAQRFASALERFTERYPYQYFNFFDIWEQ